ncbi:hypothetical protein FO519_008940 [Halicephalobus sp. NKZ332]|nr:hypothetical protein FO519_008940 [Halicephalobus sp. NKZ332]
MSTYVEQQKYSNNISQLNEKVTDMIKLIDQQKKDLEQKQTEVEGLESEIRNLEESKSRLDNECRYKINQLQEELHYSKNTYNELWGAHRQLKNTCENYKRKLEYSKQTLAEAESARDRHLAEITRLKEKLEASNNRIRNLERELRRQQEEAQNMNGLGILFAIGAILTGGALALFLTGIIGGVLAIGIGFVGFVIMAVTGLDMCMKSKLSIAFKHLLDRFNSGHKPGEFLRTVRFLEEYLLNEQNITIEDINAIFIFLETDRRVVDVPLWCFIKCFKTIKDEFFIKELSDLHTEIELLLETGVYNVNEVGNVIDDILGLQIDKSTFRGLDEVIQLVVLLRYAFASGSEILTTKRETIKRTWNEKSFNVFFTDDDILTRFFAADARLLCTFLLTKLKSDQDLDAFDALIEDFKQAPISDSEWCEVIDWQVSSVKYLHANVINKSVQHWLKNTVNENEHKEKFKSFQIVVLELFAEKQWILSNFKSLIKKIHCKEDLDVAINVLNMIYEYDLSGRGSILDELENESRTWLPNTLEKATTYVFNKKSREQELNTLIELIVESCEESENMITRDKLFQKIEKFKNTLNKLRKNISSIEEIKSYLRRNFLTNQIEQATRVFSQHTISVLQKGAEHAANYFNNDIGRAALAVHAVELFRNVEFREVQILTILIAQHAREKNQGRLLQMQTGEGKTYVVAAIAVAEALRGTAVDIVTSSSELAVIQFNDLKFFYKSIGLTVAHNANNNASNQHGGEDAEAALIARMNVFLSTGIDPGSIHDQEQVYRANIVYGSVNDYIADILLSEFAGRDIRFNRKHDLVIVDEVDSMTIDGRNDSVRLSSKTPGMNDLLQIHATIWGQVMSVFSQMQEIDGQWHYQYEGELKLLTEVGLESFVKESTLPYLEKFPSYMTEYVQQQLPKWVDSAINARFKMRPGFDYVISGGKIVCVDAANTGVHHPSMRWSDGLHQFLQMKHGCYLDGESLATNFMSNVTFFLRYNTNVLGLTGTIGGESSRHFLREVYKVDFVDIPPFRERLHCELAPHIAITEDAWLDTIVSTTSEKLELGRAVLVITQYIKYAAKIYDKLMPRHGEKNVYLYTDSDGAKVVSSKLNKGQAIVATNIAGRGTDILISDEVENMGGLHVLLTFLPDNDRVERQNVGRTSRTDEESIAGIQSSRRSLLQILREKRDKASMEAMEYAMKQLEDTKRQDGAFRKYLEIRGNVVKNKSLPEETIKNSLDTRFAKHLRTEKKVSAETVESHFENIVKCGDRSAVFENPYDLVDAALQLGGLKNAENFSNDNYTETKKFLEKAMKIDEVFCAAAHYQRGALWINDYRCGKETRFLDNAIECLKKAKLSLELKKLNQETFLQATTPNKDDEPKSELVAQIERRTVLTTSLINHIDNLVGRSCKEDFEYIDSRLASPDCKNDEKENLQKQRKELTDKRNDIEKGILGSVRSNGHSVNIKLLPLTKVLPSNERSELFTKEFEHFNDDMFSWIIEVNEKPPINWWAVASIVGLGVLQLVGGASAAVFSLGVGASIGWTLLQEGACDIIYGIYNGICKRNISWATYGIRKAINLTITLVSFGIGAIKSAVKGMVQGAKGAMQIAKQTATRVTEEGWKLAAKAIGKTVAKEVGKHAISRVIDYVSANTVEKSVTEIIKSAVTESLVKVFGENKYLKTLMNCDEIRQNAYFSEMLAGEIMGPLHNNDSLIKQLQEGVMDITNKSLERAGFEVEAKIFSTTVKDVPASITFKENAKITEILEEEKKRSQSTSNKYDDQVAADRKPFTTHQFLGRLSNDITALISSQLMGIAKQYVVSKSADIVSSKVFKSVDESIEKYRECFVESQVVINKIAEKRKTLTTELDQYTADHLEEVAKDTPGDLRQAEILAEVVEQPIIIRTVGDDGKEKVIRTGTKHAGKEPIELIFHRGNNPGDIGHYTLADGTSVTESGEYNCLYDTISAKTKYDPKLLRKGVANMMLNRFEAVKQDLVHRDFADLCVGGHSQFRERHWKGKKSIKRLGGNPKNYRVNPQNPDTGTLYPPGSYNDQVVLTLLNESAANRGYPSPVDGIEIGEDNSSEIDNLAKSEHIKM